MVIFQLIYSRLQGASLIGKIVYAVLGLFFLLAVIAVFANLGVNVLSIIIAIVLIVLGLVVTLLVGGLVSAVETVAGAAAGSKRARELQAESPELARMEAERARLSLMSLLFFFGAIVVGIIAFAITGFVGGIIAGIAVMAVYALLISPKRKKLNADFKQVVVLEELRVAFGDVQFDPGRHLSGQEIQGLKFIADADVVRGDDWLEAARNGTRFCRSDLRVFSETITYDDEGDKHVSHTTMFEGYVVRLERSESYPARLMAWTKDFRNVQGAPSDLSRLIGKAEQTLETESDAFNQRFDAFCGDQAAARVILTPQMIDRITRVGEFVRGEFAILFEDRYLYLFVSTPNKNNFEMNVSDRRPIADQRAAIVAQVANLAYIIDTMQAA